jgi:methylmalonyl-CoA mutase N-terminal domain/subunit
MVALLEDIPLDKTSFSLIVAATTAEVMFAQYLAEAERRGIDFKNLRGSVQNDPIHLRYCGFEPANPPELGRKTGVDIIEYCARYVPQWYPTTINLYDLREQGITAAQEIAFGFGIGLIYVDGVLERGLSIDDFAPRLTFYVSAHIDFLEEIAKMRAARRLWAKIMKERYGAKNPRSWQFRFAVHTAGCSLVPQQPLNNIIRVAYEALAAVLGGVQSLHCCSYDEPIALPTEQSHLLAMRTQQILAYETGVASVSDPMGGSYYIETLTNLLEEEALKILQQIEENGGMMKAITSGWLDREMEKAALEEQRRVETREHLLVGANILRMPPEKSTPGGVQRIPSHIEDKVIAEVHRLKKERSQLTWRQAIDNLKRRAEKGEKENLIPSVMNCVKAGATLGEIMGVIRQAYGYSYDPMGVLESPF